MDIIVTNQASVLNGDGNGYNWADYTASATTRAFALTNGSNVGSTAGALVTTFNAAATPEPALSLVLGIGIVGLLAAYKRRSAKA